jgi:hypothetical protein
VPRKRLSGHIAVVAGPHAAPAQLPRATAVPPQTLLDLGSGGGNNALLTAAGFQPKLIPFDHSDLEPGSYELFAASRPV